MLLLLPLLVHLSDLLLRRSIIAALFFQATPVVRVCGGINVEKGVHLTTGSVGFIKAIGGLISGLEAARLCVELSSRVVVLVSHSLLLSRRCCLGVFLDVLLVFKPTVISSVVGIFVVFAMDARVVPLPAVGGILVVVWQRFFLALTGGFFICNCGGVSTATWFNDNIVREQLDNERVSLGVGFCKPETWYVPVP